MLKILKSRLKLIKLATQWKYWSKKIAEAAENILGDCEVYVFGSIVENRATGGSDVDILIVSDKVPLRAKERWKIKAEIEEIAGLPLYHPYEIHLVNKREAKWYMKHIKKKILVKPKPD